MTVLLVILFVGGLIFVHELGHFLAAKWAGVRVDKFYLGFDFPITIGSWHHSGTLVKWRRGETDYGIGWFPLGGYVRMLGQDDADPSAPRTEDPHDFRNRPALWRLAILLGGVAMNALFALIFTVIAYWVGINFQVPLVGRVEPGSAAWEAGLEPGDLVVEISGGQPDDFSDIAIEAATSRPGTRLDLTVLRGDTRHEVQVAPRYDGNRGLATIGIAPASSAILHPSEAAAAAGLESGDRLVGWRPAATEGEVEVIPYDPLDDAAFSAYCREHAGTEISLVVERDGARREVSVPISADERAWELGLGTAQGGRRIVALRGDLERGTPAGDGRLFPGDEVIALDGTPIATGRQALDMLAAATADVQVTLQPWWDSGDDESYRRLLRRFSGAGSPRLVETAARGAYYAEVLDAQDADAAAEREAGLLFALDDIITTRPLAETHVALLDVLLARARLGRLATTDRAFRDQAAALETRRGGQLGLAEGGNAPRFHTVVTLPRDVAQALCLMPGVVDRDAVVFAPAAPRESGVVIAQVNPGSPARAAGLEAPCLLTGVVTASETTPVRDIQSLAALVQESKGAPLTLLVSSLDAAGQPHDAREVRVTPRAPGRIAGLAFRPNIHRVRDAVGLGRGWDRTLRQFKSMLAQLTAIFSGRVSASNVGGPILIVQASYQAGKDFGIGRLLYLIAFISVNLAVINLFPVPPFDGGHIALLAWEKASGKPASERVMAWFGNLGLLVFLVLIVLVFWNDISRLIS